jgi:thioredoxin reductase (NADPH)
MDTNVIVVGAGPIGIEVAAALKAASISYLHFEAKELGHTMTWWPRNTTFFSSPEWIAVAGIPIQTVGQGMITGEEYLSYLRTVVETRALEIRTFEKVARITRGDEGFRVQTLSLTGRHDYTARRVVLATGDMAFPNLLGIPGEDLGQVTHYFNDPHDYFQRRLLIVGGRNSALEAALRCWRAGVHVTLSYRRKALDEDRVLSRIYLDVSLLIENRKIRFLPGTIPVRIEPGNVTLERVLGEDAGARIDEPADFVFLATGHQPDNTLYETAGVELLGEEKKPSFDPNTMETNVPGLYVAGTATAGRQRRYRVFITTCHEHAARIVRSVAGDRPVVTGNLPGRDYPLSPEEIE